VFEDIFALVIFVYTFHKRVRRRHCAENSTVFAKNFVRAKTTCGEKHVHEAQM